MCLFYPRENLQSAVPIHNRNLAASLIVIVRDVRSSENLCALRRYMLGDAVNRMNGTLQIVATCKSLTGDPLGLQIT